MLFITHDLGIVAAIADRVLILDQGNVCEEGLTMELLRAPKHEYTQRLIDAAPSIAQVTEGPTHKQSGAVNRSLGRHRRIDSTSGGVSSQSMPVQPSTRKERPNVFPTGRVRGTLVEAS